MVNLPRWQIIMIALIVLHGVVYAAPNVLFSRQQAMQMADEGSILPHQQISLGLDLRGGVYLLLGVDLSALVEQDRENLQESIRGALNEAGMTERSEEHTSELQSLMRISYAVFCLKKKRGRTKTLKSVS